MGVESEQFGFKTYEFTASPWQSRLALIHSDEELRAKHNPRRLKSHEGFNFFLACSRYDKGEMTIDLTAYSPDGEIPDFAATYTVKVNQ